MSVTVKIFTHAGGRPTLYASRTLDVSPISIGRDDACTIMLEDPHKHISRFHVEIEQEGSTYWMSVVSKVNPVMVKGRRYGPATRLTMKSGDAFEIGEYEVQVLLPDPKEEAKVFEEPTYVGPPKEEKAKAEEKPATAPAAEDAMVRAFLEGAGMPQRELTPAEAERLMRNGGAILRAAVEGIMMLLIARAEMRKEFQAEERTMVGARDNNPLKLMSDPHEAMGFMFDPAERTEGFLDPVQALGDACEDLRSHEIALMAAMRAAILGAVRRLDPHALERAFEKTSSGFSLGGRKARLWELFVAHQEKLSRDAEEDFSKVFGRDFMGAYQAQLRRLKGGK
ncbi:MAG: type VI secretion system-associated FHA domain protein TagH [Betaproteobacteria bacterium]